MKLTKIFLGTVLLAATAGAFGQVTKSGSGYLIRMKFVKGQTMKYDMSVKASQGGQNLDLQMPMVSTVREVSNGIGTLDTKVGPIMMNGRQLAPARTQVIRRDNKGNTVGSTKLDMPGANTIGYPPKPLKKGGTWTAKTKTQLGTGGTMDVEATYKLIGEESVGGRQCVKISVALKGSGNAKVTGTNMLWIAVADGSLVRSTTSMSVVMDGRTVPMTMSVIRK